MDTGQAILISSRLILGAVASFFAIMLWSKTRDAAWMFIVIGTIVMYAEIVYSILDIFGMTYDEFIFLGSVPVILFVLPTLRMIFFIAAFVLMVIRQSRHT
ncbi:MAG: hypothetical protein LBB81_06925 [Treponema sp.]|nr:hypothetical protein [Treponema sp.]